MIAWVSRNVGGDSDTWRMFIDPLMLEGNVICIASFATADLFGNLKAFDASESIMSHNKNITVIQVQKSLGASRIFSVRFGAIKRFAWEKEKQEAAERLPECRITLTLEQGLL